MMLTPLYPGGKIKALTFSYDDGVRFDGKLIEIFNRYGMKGTFNLNAGSLASERKFHADELKDANMRMYTNAVTSGHSKMIVLTFYFE